MKSEKRMVGDYTVLCAVNIGSREIILAENEQDKNGERFLCCYVERNDIFQRYSECAVGDDYIDAALFFAERIKRDAELFRSEVEKLDIPVTVIAEADCIPDHYKNDINGKVIAINPAVLKPEYRRADRQLYLVTGGFGASANSRGSAVFCTNLYDGKPTRYERMDVMGEVKTECMPHWAVNKATVLKHIQGNKLIFEYGGKHFCPYRLFTKAEDTLDFISRHTARDNDLGLTDKPNAGDKSHYDHSAFYERSSIKNCDLFICVDNGKLYCPGEKEMFEWRGEVGKADFDGKTKAKPSRNKDYMTPYTEEGRRIYVSYRTKHKPLPCDRPSINTPEDILLSAYARGKGWKANFEYFMNREYAYNRDKGKCKCCGRYFSDNLPKHCHHVNNKLPVEKINKVSNLAWLCVPCHRMVHNSPIYPGTDQKTIRKIEQYKQKLT